MSPRTRQTLFVAAAIVGLVAVAGIVAIEGLLPLRLGGETSANAPAVKLSVAGTAPPESLSPGESVVASADEPPKAAPPASAAAPAPAPAREAARSKTAPPRAPTYSQAPSSDAPDPRVRAVCPKCGVVASTAYHQAERIAGPWEVRVRFDDGSRRILRYPTDPGFRVGERVIFLNGRLHRD